MVFRKWFVVFSGLTYKRKITGSFGSLLFRLGLTSGATYSLSDHYSPPQTEV